MKVVRQSIAYTDAGEEYVFNRYENGSLRYERTVRGDGPDLPDGEIAYVNTFADGENPRPIPTAPLVGSVRRAKGKKLLLGEHNVGTIVTNYILTIVEA